MQQMEDYMYAIVYALGAMGNSEHGCRITIEVWRRLPWPHKLGGESGSKPPARVLRLIGHDGHQEFHEGTMDFQSPFRDRKSKHDRRDLSNRTILTGLCGCNGLNSPSLDSGFALPARPPTTVRRATSAVVEPSSATTFSEDSGRWFSIGMDECYSGGLLS